MPEHLYEEKFRRLTLDFLESLDEDQRKIWNKILWFDVKNRDKMDLGIRQYNSEKERYDI